MKKMLALLLGAVMILGLAACKDEPLPTVPTASGGIHDPVDTTPPTEPEDLNRVVYCPAEPLAGDFSGGLFFGNAGDAVVAELMENAALYLVDSEGSFVRNPRVVADEKILENNDGTVTYLFTLMDDLCFSNGQQVTAWDYAARLLFVSSGAAAEQGAGEGTYAAIQGGTAYHNGETDTLRGLRVPDDRTLVLTLTANYGGYFFRESLLTLTPWHMDSWLGGDLRVDDDGDGVYIVRGGKADGIRASDVEHARQAAAFGFGGIVTSGPYVLESFSSGTATLVVNGAYSGTVPAIGKILVSSEAVEGAFREILPGAADPGDLIPGAGYAYLNFTCDATPTQFLAVRQAIASLVDRQALIYAVCPDYGTPIDGPYCAGLWQYKATQETLTQELEHYEPNLNQAIALLEEDGWIYSAQGTPWVGEGPRYKAVTGEQARFADGCVQVSGVNLMPLTIRWCAVEGSAIARELERQLTDARITGLGIEFKLDTLPAQEVNLLVNRQKDASFYYSMTVMTTRFTSRAYDNAMRFDPGSTANLTHLVDEGDGSLSQIAKHMNFLTSPGDEAGYLALWQQYVRRCSELLPELPLFGNIYAVTVPENVTGYDASPYHTFAQSILDAALAG
ncbi:MAG: ABC transporter substrate-binding protein [Faecousia sp.]